MADSTCALRYKKAACHLESSPPCELCIRYNKECTFVESPAKRRRPTTDGGGSGSEKRQSISSASGLPGYSSSRNNSISMGNTNGLPNFSSASMAGGVDMQQDMMSWHNGMAPFQMQPMQSMGMNGSMGGPDFPLDPAFYQEPMPFEAFEPMSAGTMHSMDMKTPHHEQRGSMDFDPSPQSLPMQLPVNLNLPVDSTSGEPSLDQQPSSNVTIVGLSGSPIPTCCPATVSTSTTRPSGSRGDCER